MSACELVIVDLGLGNLRSVARGFERAGASVRVVSEPDSVRSSDRIVVPGQGGFRDCAAALERGFGAVIGEFIASGKPYFGICLGMQMLFESSAEAEGARGLGLYRGRVERFPGDAKDAQGNRLKVPHMGWNEVVSSHALLPEREYFYFVHSYHCVPTDASLTVGIADYGGPFCAAVARDNVFACQFHPEKSQDAGQELMRRFLRET